ncbi:MAG: alcohol dehydrogenase catalytic domain-containing protein [Planctomycetota bacterium]|jgi:threonine dehydrogenase-like Zn-dependent dehydrogenase
MTNLPKTQYAVQLVGPDELVLNKSKEIHKLGPYQILCRIEACGLCFSDLKLLKQFSSHVRKGPITCGIDPKILQEIPSYVPEGKPTVPGHEAVVRIQEIGSEVEKFKPGQRYLVQTNYLWLPTEGANSSFGYNFEGGLQEFVLMDERIITSPEGESMLIPVSEEISASAAALIEPWACVEDAYSYQERGKIKSDGKMLVATDVKISEEIFHNFLNQYGKPQQLIWVSRFSAPKDLGISVNKFENLQEITDSDFDDVIYFGCDCQIIENLFDLVGAYGLLNIVLCGDKLDRDIDAMVGRVHYGAIRIIGTEGFDPSESMGYIPQTGQIRPNDKINIVGAAGPMGTMNVIRNFCQTVDGISVYAGDVDDSRLEILSQKAKPVAEKYNIELKIYNANKDKPTGFNYIALMVPRPELVSEAVKSAKKNGIINIFAGIPADVKANIDLNLYISKHLYFIGTSGSVLEDMKCVLSQVEGGRLDTNISVAAVCGLDGATKGIRAIENRTITGKIVAYPACKGLDLTTIDEMNNKMPEVAERLNNGKWTKEAEEALFEKYAKF